MSENGAALGRYLLDGFFRQWKTERWALYVCDVYPACGCTYPVEREIYINQPYSEKRGHAPGFVLVHEMVHAFTRLLDTPAAEHLIVENISKAIWASLDEKRKARLASMLRKAKNKRPSEMEE